MKEVGKLNYDLSLDVEQITVWQGSIQFAEYEILKEQALDLAAEIKTVEVNEETLKISKKMLAAVNKSIKELEDRRISIKRLLLEPYQVFEGQVKEIVSIVKEADEIVRDQIRGFEENQRNEKEMILKDKFEKRIVHYSFRDLFNFKDFLHPKHLNKTTTIEAAENEMVEFLNKLARDIKAIEKMPNPEAVLRHYTTTKDIAEAITLHAHEEAKKQQIEASKTIKKDPFSVNYLVSIPIQEKKDLTLVEMFLKANDIDYSIDQITL